MAMDLVEVGSRIPETLGGNFRLDDHNVEEWSDSEIPGVRYKARQETGKWINSDTDADIKYRKHEDCKESTRGKEKTRTEVIEGQAPDSTFHIVRSHTQYQDGGNSRVQSSSSSYQMSSSKGGRGTSKSTSNRTTTKTVTVSGTSGGGIRSDDFENLGMSFQPLDTSTQRERINVSRSGTMGVRRPPTRRHTPATPAPALSSSPDDDIDTRDEIIVDSDVDMRMTPDIRNSGLSIVGFKDISSKIRVGFPVEIQLELQTKLRSASHLGRNLDEYENKKEKNINLSTTNGGYQSEGDVGIGTNTKSSPFFVLPKIEKNEEPKRKSFVESFERRLSTERTPIYTGLTVAPQQPQDREVTSKYSTSVNNNNPFSYVESFAQNRVLNHTFNRERSENKTSDVLTSDRFVTPRLSPVSRSWDLIQNAKSAQQNREEKKFNAMLSVSPDVQQANATNSTFTTNPYKKSIVNVKLEDDFKQDYNLESLSPPLLDLNMKSTTFKTEETENNYTPDIITLPTLSPSLERSRRLLKMLDEKPDILHKMSFKNYYSEASDFTNKSPEEEVDWESRNYRDESSNWEAQRQLSFLNDSLTRILEDGRHQNPSLYDDDTENIFGSKLSSKSAKEEDSPEMDINGNNIRGSSSTKSQVSQTWISSLDSQKPSQKVRDNEVTTTISATHDPLFKRGPKKVEFCKTEVHFTADSGKFHIVETVPDKPSTSHLFRKKKKDKNKGNQVNTTAQTQLDKPEGETAVEHNNFDTSNLQQALSEVLIESESEYQKKIKSSSSEKIFSRSSSGLADELVNDSPPPQKHLSQEDDNTQSKFVSLLSLRRDSTGNNDEENVEELRSPSHAILSNYGEMKIQRYLNHLKSPSGSPPSQQVFDFLPASNNTEEEPPRFDNILYENGSFVPLATRRSLIEMNNSRNQRKRQTSNSRDSSTMSNYSLPHSDKEYQPLRLARMEAKVATARPNPQITSVELRYEFDDDEQQRGERPYNPEPDMGRKLQLNLGDREYAPQDAMKSRTTPQHRERYSYSLSPENESELYRADTRERKFSETELRTRMPPLMTYATPEGDPVSRSYYQNPLCECESKNTSRPTELAMSASTISSMATSKASSKSIVTIGDYDVCRNDTHSKLSSRQDSNDLMKHHQHHACGGGRGSALEERSPEPVLSMDHTWKGPAANFEDECGTIPSPVKSYTLPKLSRNEPEWVYKARNRESRVTDWEMVGKQHSVSVTPVENEQPQPPWIDDLMRFRSKSSNEKANKLPKISVVYPWQRDNNEDNDSTLVNSATTKSHKESESLKSSSVERHQKDQTHIVSIVPTPPPSYSTSSSRPPKSMQTLPLLELANRDIIDRDAESILINTPKIIKKRQETTGHHYSQINQQESQRLNQSSRHHHHHHTQQQHGSDSGPKSRQSQSVETSTTKNGRMSHRSNHESTQGKIEDAGKPPKGIKSPEKNRSGGKSMTSLKEGRTSERSSSSKGVRAAGGDGSQPDPHLFKKESPATSRSNTPTIHRHPLVKVSKLPIRKNLPPLAPRPERHPSSRQKDKHAVPSSDSDSRQNQPKKKPLKDENDTSTSGKTSTKDRKIEQGGKSLTRKKPADGGRTSK